MIEDLKFAYKTAQSFVRNFIQDGDFVIDMTSGNGNDTLFLSIGVGPTGKVLTIDIDEKAINSTRERVTSKSPYPENVVFVNDTHANLMKLLPGEQYTKARAIMFNLGYLPGSDKVLRTNPTSTLSALKQAIEVLDTPGIITIVFYPHETGKEEWRLCQSYLKNLTGNLNSYLFKRINRKDPPFLVIIVKD